VPKGPQAQVVVARVQPLPQLGCGGGMPPATRRHRRRRHCRHGTRTFSTGMKHTWSHTNPYRRVHTDETPHPISYRRAPGATVKSVTCLISRFENRDAADDTACKAILISEENTINTQQALMNVCVLTRLIETAMLIDIFHEQRDTNKKDVREHF